MVGAGVHEGWRVGALAGGSSLAVRQAVGSLEGAGHRPAPDPDHAVEEGVPRHLLAQGGHPPPAPPRQGVPALTVTWEES